MSENKVRKAGRPRKNQNEPVTIPFEEVPNDSGTSEGLPPPSSPDNNSKEFETTVKDSSTDKDTKIRISLIDDNALEETITKPTVESKPDDAQTIKSEEPISSFSGRSPEDVKAEIKRSESEQLKPEDFELVSKFAIDIFDMLIVTILRIVAKDDVDSPYEIAESKKQKLTYQLTLILIKYQKKFKIEFLFLATLFVAYFTPTKKALGRRKLMNKLKKAREDDDKQEVNRINAEIKREKGRPGK